jgi:purine-binding chemotaxis protein CheW
MDDRAQGAGLGAPDEVDEGPAGAVAEGLERVISFWLRGQLFALPIAQVRETLAMGKRAVTRVFQTPDFVLGIVNLRGTILAVLDLGRYLGLGRATLGETTRVLVAEGAVQRRTAGLLVDAVAPWRAVDPAGLAAAPPTLRGERAACVRGVVTLEGGRPLALLDLDAVIGAPELKQFQRKG